MHDQPFELREGMEILSRTPDVLRAWLTGLSPAWLAATEGPQTWSPLEVVGHLIHGEKTDWIPRVRRILSAHPETPFEPFDRFAHLLEGPPQGVEALLDELETLRRQNLEELGTLGLTEASMELKGIHPELGPVTLGQLLATWVAHDLSHLGQIARVMAKRQARAVGPWHRYLSILRR